MRAAGEEEVRQVDHVGNVTDSVVVCVSCVGACRIARRRDKQKAWEQVLDCADDVRDVHLPSALVSPRVKVGPSGRGEDSV